MPSCRTVMDVSSGGRVLNRSASVGVVLSASDPLDGFGPVVRGQRVEVAGIDLSAERDRLDTVGDDRPPFEARLVGSLCRLFPHLEHLAVERVVQSHVGDHPVEVVLRQQLLVDRIGLVPKRGEFHPRQELPYHAVVVHLDGPAVAGLRVRHVSWINCSDRYLFAQRRPTPRRDGRAGRPSRWTNESPTLVRATPPLDRWGTLERPRSFATLVHPLALSGTVFTVH